MSEKTCKSCAWWKCLREDCGECRESPPQSVVMPERTYATDFGMRTDTAYTRTEWPRTTSADWCGKWKEKVKAGGPPELDETRKCGDCKASRMCSQHTRIGIPAWEYRRACHDFEKAEKV